MLMVFPALAAAGGWLAQAIQGGRAIASGVDAAKSMTGNEDKPEGEEEEPKEDDETSEADANAFANNALQREIELQRMAGVGDVLGQEDARGREMDPQAAAQLGQIMNPTPTLTVGEPQMNQQQMLAPIDLSQPMPAAGMTIPPIQLGQPAPMPMQMQPPPVAPPKQQFSDMGYDARRAQALADIQAMMAGRRG